MYDVSILSPTTAFPDTDKALYGEVVPIPTLPLERTVRSVEEALFTTSNTEALLVLVAHTESWAYGVDVPTPTKPFCFMRKCSDKTEELEALVAKKMSLPEVEPESTNCAPINACKMSELFAKPTPVKLLEVVSSFCKTSGVSSELMKERKVLALTPAG